MVIIFGNIQLAKSDMELATRKDRANVFYKYVSELYPSECSYVFEHLVQRTKKVDINKLPQHLNILMLISGVVVDAHIQGKDVMQTAWSVIEEVYNQYMLLNIY